METLSRIWNRFFYTGCHPEQLGILRIAIGLGMLPFHGLQFKALLKFDLDGVIFHFVDPIWYFRLLGIEAVDPAGCLVAFSVLMIATLMFALGLFTRASVFTMLISILYLKGMRDSLAGDVHHRYLIPFTVLFFFGLSRCGDIFSLDALRARRKGVLEAIAVWEASWPIRAGQLYVCSFYLWSAIAKARMSGTDWIAGGTRIQHLLLDRAVRFGFDEGQVIDGSQTAFDLAHNITLAHVLGGMTYVFEFGFPLILFIRDTRLRLIFFAGVTFFHLANYILINVQFVLLPIIFLLFFDVSSPLKRWGRAGGAA